MKIALQVRQPGMRDFFEEDCEVEQVGTGFGFTEGPVWDAAESRLIFSDMKDDHMRQWSHASGVRTYRRPSGKANGSAFDRRHRLVSCEHATSRVVRQKPDGSTEILASHFEGRELNSPNDIVVDAAGAIYFTDPTYGRIREDLGILREPQLPFRGVYRIAGDGAAPQLLARDFEQPNGLCFSLDGRRLFVNDTSRQHIRAFDVLPDGNVTGGAVWAETTGEGIGMPDGMKVDSMGYLYCTGPGGIHVFDHHANCLGVVGFPEKPSNFIWGDDDLKSLYATCMTSIYRVRTKVPGHLPY